MYIVAMVTYKVEKTCSLIIRHLFSDTIDHYHTAVMLSLGGGGGGNKKLCFCTASLAVNSIWPGFAMRKQSFLFPRDSTWPPSDKGLLNCIN